MGALADACKRIPFANGTEGDAWMEKWCGYCTHDHAMHGGDGPGCDVLLHAYAPDEVPWPECWLPAPPGRDTLPSRLVCLAFSPCEPCGGDPGAEDRAERVAEVSDYWRESGR